jgi:hypothetical protein
MWAAFGGPDGEGRQCGRGCRGWEGSQRRTGAEEMATKGSKPVSYLPSAAAALPFPAASPVTPLAGTQGAVLGTREVPGKVYVAGKLGDFGTFCGRW